MPWKGCLGMLGFWDGVPSPFPTTCWMNEGSRLSAHQPSFVCLCPEDRKPGES